MSKIGSMILLVHLKLCWCILNFAGSDFEVKCVPAKYMHQQNSAGVHQKILTVGVKLLKNSSLPAPEIMLNQFLSPPASTRTGALTLNTLVHWPGHPVNISWGTFVIALAVGTSSYINSPAGLVSLVNLQNFSAQLRCCLSYPLAMQSSGYYQINQTCSLPTGHSTWFSPTSWLMSQPIWLLTCTTNVFHIM